jgi:hypothetical protein
MQKLKQNIPISTNLSKIDNYHQLNIQEDKNQTSTTSKHSLIDNFAIEI